MCHAVKFAARRLAYSEKQGMPIDSIDTYSFSVGGSNALSLAGYTNMEIKKMGRWRSATFKEYTQEQLRAFSKGMSKKMGHAFNFINVGGGACHKV